MWFICCWKSPPRFGASLRQIDWLRCYVFVGKVLSQSKEDSNYFQAVMIAFSVFFLLINIGREIKTIATNWQKKDAADKEASNQAGE